MKKLIMIVAVMATISVATFASAPKTNNHGFVLEKQVTAPTVKSSENVVEQPASTETPATKPAKKNVAKKAVKPTTETVTVSQTVEQPKVNIKTAKKELKKELKAIEREDVGIFAMLSCGLATIGLCISLYVAALGYASGIAGIVLGIIGLCKGNKKFQCITGIVFGALAVILSTITFLAIIAAAA